MAGQGLFERINEWLGLGVPEEEDEEPGVTWMLLPAYDIPGMAVVSGLLVENQSFEDAGGLFVRLSYPSDRFITHLEVISEDPYEVEGGGPRDAFVQVRLARLAAGHRVVIYVAGHNEQQPEVTVALQDPAA